MDELDQIDTWVLPESWCYAKLEDLGYGENAIVDGPFGSNLKVSDYIDDSANGVPVLTTKNLEGNYSKGSVRYISRNKYEELKRSKVQSGDILVAKIGSIGKTGIYPSGMKAAIIPANLLKFTVTPSVDFKYVFAYLNCFNFQQFIKLISTATAQPAFNVTKFRKLPIPLPPLNEQHRIVAKIEELFSELDKGVENLRTAQAQLKVYRQALLKHAFEGKLTREWREQNRDKLETAAALQQRIQQERAQRYQQQLVDREANGKQGGKPKAPKSRPPLTAEELAELPELPDGWGWTRLGNTNVEVSDGPFGSNLKSSDYVESGVRVVRLENIGALKFIEEKESYVTEEKYELIKRHTVTSGDIVFSSFIIENVRVALVPPSITKAINKADCFCVRFSGETLSNVYAVLFLSTRHVYKQLESLIHGVGRPRINTTQLKDVVVPVCGAAEQQVIIAEIESRLSEVEQLEQTITTSLQQTEALRQSILKKAFSGQLVAQDANDESAAALLARIKAEKAAQAITAKLPKSRKTAKPEPTKTNVIPFPAKIPGISHSELHAGIMALAYKQHELSRRAWYFGHVKAEKISHMVESLLGIDLDRRPIKDAAGPNDFKRLLAVESLAHEQKWFDVQKQKSGRHVLHKMEGFDDLIRRTSAALVERLDSVKALIGHFIGLNKTRSEIVATLYAAWNNLLLLGRIPSDEEIVFEATENWHADKLKIRRERFFNCLGWMRGHGLVPKGRGRYVAKKGERSI